jgi:polar amino acid transport system substrate-binding protein
MSLRRTAVTFAILVCALVAPAGASEHVTIGTKISPPFSMKADDGTWTGISIELWKQIATDLDLTYDIKEYDIKGLLAAVQAKDIDVAVASTTITADREAVMDFTHPIYSTGLGIAVKPGGSGGTLAIVRGLLTWDLLKVLGGLFVLLAVTGALVWLFERRKNDAQFAKHPVQGIAAGVWWSAVTMTTVGYGDKSPVTVGGRVIGLMWMFSAIILISVFTATITSTLTVDRLESAIKGPEDLPRVKVATVEGSTSADYLKHHHITFQTVPAVIDGLKQVANGTIDAMVYDAPIMQYLASHELGGTVAVLPNVFERQDYGFAIPDGSPLRERINRVLLKQLASDRWTELLERYLGKP